MKGTKCHCCGNTMVLGIKTRTTYGYDDYGHKTDVFTELVEAELCTNDDCNYSINMRDKSTYHYGINDLPF